MEKLHQVICARSSLLACLGTLLNFVFPLASTRPVLPTLITRLTLCAHLTQFFASTRTSPPLWQRQMDVFRGEDQDPMIREFAHRVPKDAADGVKIKKAVLTLLLASGKIRKLGPRPVVV